MALARMMHTTPDRVRAVRIGDADLWASTVAEEQRERRMAQSAKRAGLD